MWSKLYITLFLVAKIYCDCEDFKNCTQCTSHKSWNGRNCRWCYRDRACHTFGSLFSNPCTQAQDIVDKEYCSIFSYKVKYNPDIAYDLALYSAVTYAPSAFDYLCMAFPNRTFYNLFQETAECFGGVGGCSGYTVVSPEDEAIVVAFRGTQSSKQLLVQVLQILTVPKKHFVTGGRVQYYFLDAFNRIWPELKKKISKNIASYPSYDIWIAGHSLGGALATLASAMLVHSKMVSPKKLHLYTFGEPRVGNYHFGKGLNKLVPSSWRLVHYRDIVPHLPPCKEVIPFPHCMRKGGFPFHRDTEVFYPDEDMRLGSKYELCRGEDLACGNSPAIGFSIAKCFLTADSKCLNDHRYYFGFNLSRWWKKFTTLVDYRFVKNMTFTEGTCPPLPIEYRFASASRVTSDVIFSIIFLIIFCILLS